MPSRRRGPRWPQFAKDNPGLAVVDERFTSEPYGLGIPNYDGRFQDLVNFTLQEMKVDSTYDRLYRKWFGSDTPFALEVWPGQSYLDLDMIPMVRVPAGEYVRGNRNGFPDEKAEQLLHIDDFYFDEYEVTNRQYAQCVQAGRCTSPRLPRSVNFANYYAQFDFADFPAIGSPGMMLPPIVLSAVNAYRPRLSGKRRRVGHKITFIPGE